MMNYIWADQAKEGKDWFTKVKNERGTSLVNMELYTHIWITTSHKLDNLDEMDKRHG
jgi:hypothetical protein